MPLKSAPTTRVTAPATALASCFAVTPGSRDPHPGHSFGQARTAFVRVVNQHGGTEPAHCGLSEDAVSETAMIFGDLYRNGTEGKFRVVGQGYAGGLTGIANDFGVNVLHLCERGAGETRTPSPARPPQPTSRTPGPGMPQAVRRTVLPKSAFGEVGSQVPGRNSRQLTAVGT